jgi:deaminated glutathione amidase
MNGRKITAAAIQMSSTPNKGENLDTAERLIRSAASSGADLIALPELWNCHGLEDVYRENAEPVPGPTTEFLGGLAHELGVYLLDSWGTVLAQCPDRDGYALATLDLDYVDRIREEFPALKNRRPDTYKW